MKEIENRQIKFVSKQDGLHLWGLLLVPQNPKAVLQISHGMCEHKERYIAFMEYMARAGYACVIHDHRGHGKSIKSSEDLGYFYENGGEAIVEDLHQVTEVIKEQFPELPYFLFGHSMGSLAVRCYIKKYDKEIDGLIVCGSPSDNSMTNVGLALDKLLQKCKGDHARSDFVDELFSKGFEKPFASEMLPHAWICSDKEVVKKYNEEPLCNFTFTLNGYEALLWLVKNTYSKQGWKLENATLPIHFISGAMDPCMINEQKFIEAVERMKQVGYQEVTSHLYPNMRHEILNEIGKEQVYVDVEKFYNEILKSIQQSV